MVYRDPQTGQFKSDGESSSTARNTTYEHLDPQYFSGAVFVSNDTSSGTVKYDELGLDGDLRRDEVAELVMVKADAVMRIEHEGNTITEPGTARGEAQLFREDLAFSQDTFSSDNVTDDGGGTVTERKQVSQRMENIMFIEATQTTSFNDTTNATSGAAGRESFRDTRHFREEFSAGPVFYYDSPLSININVNKDQLPNAEVKFSYELEFIWDQMELEEAEEMGIV